MIDFYSVFILETGCIPFTPGHGPFVICDYGAADGLNSLGLTTNCIGMSYLIIILLPHLLSYFIADFIVYSTRHVT